MLRLGKRTVPMLRLGRSSEPQYTLEDLIEALESESYDEDSDYNFPPVETLHARYRRSMPDAPPSQETAQAQNTVIDNSQSKGDDQELTVPEEISYSSEGDDVDTVKRSLSSDEQERYFEDEYLDEDGDESSVEKRPMNMLRLGKRAMSMLRLGKRPMNMLRLGKRPMNMLRLGKRPMNMLRLGKRPMNMLRLGKRPMNMLRLGKRPMNMLRLGKRDGQDDLEDWEEMPEPVEEGSEDFDDEMSADKRPMNMLRLGKRPMNMLRLGKRPMNMLRLGKRPMNMLRLGKRPMNMLRLGKRDAE